MDRFSVQNLVIFGLIGAGVFFLLRNMRQTPPSAAPGSVPAGGYTQVPPAFFQPEQAGADLNRAYGSPVPSGASRDLIR